MAKQSLSPKPESCPWLIPYLTVKDPQAAVEFYKKAFGFKKGVAMKGEDGNLQHVEMIWEGQSVLMFSPEGGTLPEGCGTAACQPPSVAGAHLPVNLYLYTFDVDRTFVKAVKAGAEVVHKPADMVWGDRICQIKDPDGYDWTLATKIGEFGV